MGRTSLPRSSSPTVRRGLVCGVAAVALAGGLLGCGSSSTTSAPATSAPTTAGSSTGSTPGGSTVGTSPKAPGTTYPEDGRCISRMPGEILTAEEAVVRFSSQQVCPGYVTILPGTAVTFKNRDTVAHTITITEGNMPDGKEIANGIAEPGQTWVREFNTLGTFTFVTDAVPSFRGSVEVTDGSMNH